MLGRITTRHLVTHGTLIIRLFGVSVFVRAISVAIRGGTFIEVLKM